MLGRSHEIEKMPSYNQLVYQYQVETLEIAKRSSKNWKIGIQKRSPYSQTLKDCGYSSSPSNNKGRTNVINNATDK